MTLLLTKIKRFQIKNNRSLNTNRVYRNKTAFEISHCKTVTIPADYPNRQFSKRGISQWDRTDSFVYLLASI